MSANSFYVDTFKRNDDEFRKTMEAIFQKYSALSDPGIDVCLKTLTCRTGRGPVPIDSAEGELELEALKTRVQADYSMREFEDQDSDQMDVSGVTEDDLEGSGQKENIKPLWHGGESFQLSMNLNDTSHGSLWGELSQPKEEDEELEKTLNSHGSTLLDVYPSMLNQIGNACRRQHVTDMARAVVQKYRHKYRNHQQASLTHCSSSFKSRQNCALNETTDISFTNQSPVQSNIINCFKDNKLQNLLVNKPEVSPLKNSSYEANACFYSPRRSSADVSGVTDESPWTELHLTRKPEQNTARVIDVSTPPYAGSPSLSDQSQDLDQTYDVGPTSHAVPASSVFNSPQQNRAGLSIIDQRGMSIISQSSSLNKDCFRDHLPVHSPVSSPQRGLSGVLSPSGKSRPSVLNMERQLNSTASPKQGSPVHHVTHFEALRSPYGAKHVALVSSRQSVYNCADRSLSRVEKASHFTPSKRQHSGAHSTYSFRELEIDVEFRKLYHHFICRGTSSSCPSSSCQLCERRMEMSQSPSVSSFSMSALALTPLRGKHKKRQRQPEVEESFRFKRFRESRSPLKHLQLTDRYVTSAMSELIEDKLARNKAVLLQCPSPQFLRGTGNLRRIREAKLSMQMNPHALSWRDAPSKVQIEAAVSPMRPFIQGSAALSPSLSRRRLQYGLLQ